VKNDLHRLGWIFGVIATVLLFAVPGQAYRIEYCYDSLNRLVKVIHPNGETVFYTYDEVSNRIRKVVTANPSPVLTGSIIADGQVQRSTVKSISVEFNENVTISRDALSIRGASHGSISLTSAAFNYNAGTFTATWTLAQSLPDDEYTATLDNTKIADAGGKKLDGNGDGVGGDNATFTFYRLFGDSTGDAVVDYADLSLLASRWLGTPADAGLDYNADGKISLPDFAALADNWLDEFNLFYDFLQ
jgi:YD repeat-containing protein